MKGERPKDKLKFENEYCEFVPYGWGRLKGIWYPLAFKVVTQDLKSLGLRKNPTILTFPVGKWIKQPHEELIPSNEDSGGIWTALKKGSITTLKNYCMDMYGMDTRGFLTLIDYPVFANSYRIKSRGVMLIKEIK